MNNIEQAVKENMSGILREINENKLKELKSRVDGTYILPEPTQEELYWSNASGHCDGRFGAGHPY